MSSYESVHEYARVHDDIYAWRNYLNALCECIIMLCVIEINMVTTKMTELMLTHEFEIISGDVVDVVKELHARVVIFGWTT
jgi:hypothetical protein